MYVYTQTVSCSDTHRHMYTVHTTHSASAWLIQRSIRSLTVTNSWLTAEHKKAHTLTPNLWGGLGAREGADLAAGLHSCLHHTSFFSFCCVFFPLSNSLFLHCSHLLSFFLRLSYFLAFSAFPTSVSSSVSLYGILSLPLSLSPSPSRGVIDSHSVHLSWKRRRRQCDVIHLAGDGGSAASLITGPINLTHRGRISAAVRQQTHMACLPA